MYIFFPRLRKCIILFRTTNKFLDNVHKRNANSKQWSWFISDDLACGIFERTVKNISRATSYRLQILGTNESQLRYTPLFKTQFYLTVCVMPIPLSSNRPFDVLHPLVRGGRRWTEGERANSSGSFLRRSTDFRPIVFRYIRTRASDISTSRSGVSALVSAHGRKKIRSGAGNSARRA